MDKAERLIAIAKRLAAADRGLRYNREHDELIWNRMTWGQHKEWITIASAAIEIVDETARKE